MARAGTKPMTPEQRRRELRKTFAAFGQEPPGPERARRLATFARAAHAERQLNMAMHAATLCLQDDPDQPALLVAAYTAEGTPEEELRALGDLHDLGRYVERPDLVRYADEQRRERALGWVRDGEPHERRHRLRTVQSATSRELADAIRDELQLLT